MSGITNSSRPKRRITGTEKVTDPGNASVPALASHTAAKRLAAARLPSAPSPESIGEPAAEEGSAQTTEDNSSSRVNKRKTLDNLELTDSEIAADERENSSDSTGGTKTQHKKKQRHTMKRHKSAVDPIEVDANNGLADINIVDLSAAPSMKTIRKDANRDLSEFFEEPAALTGKDGKVRKCRSCKICGTETALHDDALKPGLEPGAEPDPARAREMGWARGLIEPEPAQAEPKPGLSEPSPAQASLVVDASLVPWRPKIEAWTSGQPYAAGTASTCEGLQVTPGWGATSRERSPGADEDGRGSVEGRAVQFAHRVNSLALKMMGVAVFQANTKDMFEAPCIRMTT
ncbi:hypothetical protein JB92DRAFT_3098699 [Gautieria morchelliformis]|nr:hypothetical protein JB92DRAFT_3098699 [Gautieria morchelliformis]